MTRKIVKGIWLRRRRCVSIGKGLDGWLGYKELGKSYQIGYRVIIVRWRKLFGADKRYMFIRLMWNQYSLFNGFDNFATQFNALKCLSFFYFYKRERGPNSLQLPNISHQLHPYSTTVVPFIIITCLSKHLLALLKQLILPEICGQLADDLHIMIFHTPKRA